MDTSVKSKYSAKSKKDEHGTYPVWMSKRKVAQEKTKKKKVPKKTEFGVTKYKAGKMKKKKKF